MARMLDALVIGGDDHAVEALRLQAALVDVPRQRLAPELRQGLPRKPGGPASGRG
ncbi:hypothetical protein GCM10010272_14250 [Streptomyces lateritius]|nr:hypothetical protein GCM10010272_14250 [Streptomyces lateritius]